MPFDVVVSHLVAECLCTCWLFESLDHHATSATVVPKLSTVQQQFGSVTCTYVNVYQGYSICRGW